MMSKKAGLIVSLVATICLVLLFSITALIPKDDIYPSNEITTESTTIDEESVSVVAKNDEESTQEITTEKVPIRETTTKPKENKNEQKASEKVVNNKPTTTNKPIDRVFKVRGITIDATGSSAFDETILYVKDIVKNLPSIMLRNRLEIIYLVDKVDVYGAGEDTVGIVYGKEMYIETKLQTKKDLKSTIYHELGHLVDDGIHLGTAYYSLNTEWKELITEEGYAICKHYGHDILDSEYHSAREGFAMAIEAYFLKSINGQPFNLKGECPKIYNQIHKMIASKYVVMMWDNCEYFYFNSFDEVIDWAREKYDTSGANVSKVLSDWNKIAAVGNVLNCDYGFNIEKRN